MSALASKQGSRRLICRRFANNSWFKLFESTHISLNNIIGKCEPPWILPGMMNPSLQHRESILLFAFSIEP